MKPYFRTTLLRTFCVCLPILYGLLSFAPKPKKVIFFGDSITQAGVQPGGYIRLMEQKLTTTGKNANFELIGAGIGGNKIYDLYLRAERDVLAQKPDVVIIYVGVNDVWHKTTHGTGTDLDKFEQFYIALVQKLKNAGIQVICCTPAVIGERTDHSNQQDGDLNAYSNAIRKMAMTEKCSLVDLRAAFLAYNQANNPSNVEKGILTTDRVHLSQKGNDFVADAMLKALISL